MTTCDRIEELRDYAMGELPADVRAAMERHVAGCGHCAAELRSLQLTAAALRSVPEREIPQRIAFVSDKVFEPTPLGRWFAAWRNFASASVLAAAVIFAVTFTTAHRPAAVAPATVVQAGVSKADMDEAIGEAVTKAVAQVREQDAAVLAAADQKHEEERRAMMVAMQENLTLLEKRMNTSTMLASADLERFGGSR